MKKSIWALLFAALLGMLPLAAGLFQKTNPESSEEWMMATKLVYGGDPETVVMDTGDESADGTSAPMVAYAPSPSDIDRFSADDTAMVSTTSSQPPADETVAFTFLDSVTHIAQQLVRHNPNYVAAVGAVNTFAMTWLTFFWRRREKILTRLKDIQEKSGDLAEMPLMDFLRLLKGSVRSWGEFKRLLLRTNPQYSIYGFSHVAILPKGPGRPIQWIDRTNRSASWIMDALGDSKMQDYFTKERGLTSLHRPWLEPRAVAIKFLQGEEGSTHSNIRNWLANGDWRSDASRSTNPKDIIEQMDSGDIALSFVFQLPEERQEVFTMMGDGIEPPETLEQWEEAILAFKEENRLILKHGLLISALAIHSTVEV